MSYITIVLILCSLIEEERDNHWPAIAYINERRDLWNYHRAQFENIGDDLVTGGRCLERAIFATAINGGQIESLYAVLRTAPWRAPDMAQILVSEHEDPLWEIATIEQIIAGDVPS